MTFSRSKRPNTEPKATLCTCNFLQFLFMWTSSVMDGSKSTWYFLCNCLTSESTEMKFRREHALNIKKVNTLLLAAKSMKLKKPLPEKEKSYSQAYGDSSFARWKGFHSQIRDIISLFNDSFGHIINFSCKKNRRFLQYLLVREVYTFSNAFCLFSEKLPMEYAHNRNPTTHRIWVFVWHR